jgi:translation initiation factor 2 beta subunit (eIF-2beta)/eIF-5
MTTNVSSPLIVTCVVVQQEVVCPVCENIMTSIYGDPRQLEIECDKCGAPLKISAELEFK